MRVEGSRSWQLSESVEELLHVLLYTRDALGLALDGPGSPPRLNSGPPAEDPPLAVVDRDRLTSTWLRWWNDHVTRAALFHGADRPASASPWAAWAGSLAPPPPPGDTAAWHAWHSAFAEHDIGKPPDFAGLGDPDLRLAAVRVWPAARQWVDRGPRGRANMRAHLPYEVVREVAEDVAFDHHVDPGDVRAWILPLDVQGTWWQRWAPGVVLCSFAAAGDPRTARVALRDAFTSRL